MKLQDIFDQLSAGEFSQLSIGGAAQGVINESNHLKLVGHVTLGLTALFKRFALREGSLVVTLVPNQTVYKLAATDILKVERVMTADELELPLNDHADSGSVFTTSMSSLRIPKDLDTPSLTVTYRANHPKLKTTFGLFDPTRIDIQLPESHLEALLYYVASRVHNPIGMGQEFNSGNTYYAKYEAACQALEIEGLEIDQGGSNTRARRNGWV